MVTGDLVDVCVDRPKLALDRPFTYRVPTGMPVGTGSLIRVPFNRRLIRGWVLGEAAEVPRGRVLSIKEITSPARSFDEDGLLLARWVAARYVAPLAAVLGRLVPPRVVSEEDGLDPVGPAYVPEAVAPEGPPVTSALSDYRGGPELLDALSGSPGVGGVGPGFLVRPAPEDEHRLVVEAVAACLASGRRSLIVTPEAETDLGPAAALVGAFGARVGLLSGGSKRERYRSWLEVSHGRRDVVVTTRPGVFTSLPGLGLIWVNRESHPALREDRSPYYHVRDVALARGQIQAATVVLSAICPSSEAAAAGLRGVSPATRRWVPVEVVKPGPEGRAPRLVRAVRETQRAFILSPLRGAGMAVVCRSCGELAACASCGGSMRSEEGSIACVVCEAPGLCRACGSDAFAVRPGGRERVQAWVERAASVSVHRLRGSEEPRLPERGEILIGGPRDVRDLGPGGLDLVAILDADLAERRPGLSARERALTTWMETVSWARPGGKAIVQATHAGDPAIQALVRGNPDRFHVDEARRRAEAGFPVGSAVFRVAGTADLAPALEALVPRTLLRSGAGDRTVCLVALDPARVPMFGEAMRRLATEGGVERVEAEPHL